MPNVVYLHARPTPIAHFLRVGSCGHRQLETLLAEGKLPADRIVLDAGAFALQKDLVAELRKDRRQLILDTNVAELSSIGRYNGSVQGAPWADPDGVLTPEHFKAGVNHFDVVGQIARFAVAESISRVHAPTHWLAGGVKDSWFKVDLSSCAQLRRLLDVQGGKLIAIDYPLLVSNSVLNDAAERRVLVAALASLPFDSLWVRISGFGSDATAAGLRKYITALQDFRVLKKPVVMDGVGGLAGLAVLSFGGACGWSYGAASKERFDAGSWNKPPKGSGGGGGHSVLLPGIDRLLKKSEADAIITAPGARRLLSCRDRSCCPHGFEDTLKNPKAHYLRQRSMQCDEISSVQNQRRAQHFLDTTLAGEDRTARLASKLKVADDGLSSMLEKNAARVDRVRSVLEDLNKTAAAFEELPELPPLNEENKSATDRR